MNESRSPPRMPMRRIHELLVERMMPDLEKVISQTSHDDHVDDLSDEILDMLRTNGVPSWVAAPVLASALHKMFKFSLERSRELRAEGLTNPADQDDA